MIQRSAPIRRIPVRRRRSKPRRGPMRSTTYRRWPNDRPCVICVKLRKEAIRWNRLPPAIPTFSAAAHTQNNGMSSKWPDSSCAPLCAEHHAEQHQHGMKTFELKYGVDMKREAAAHYAVFQIAEGEL